MSTFRISEEAIKKRKRSPYWGIVWGAFLTFFVYLESPNSPVFSVTVATGFGLFIAFLIWYHNRNFLKLADQHSLVLDGASLVFSRPGAKTTLEANSISKVYINQKKRRRPISITISCNGEKSRLPPYENIEQLAESLVTILGDEKIEYRRWLHV